ncbi:6-phosphogluconolactonase [Aurantiacibacter gangjinensis]|uniref:6-phosphogluconolactonase n=1 Tax=Aurantiacibacter gangjinensis TaxID=502682 RepID=A0A0G9MMH9_9SPHN|nr:6-phosphogluconolactonase [Aurantiacibacter gangjinensis]APE27956.1 6-phosphogluconolactonase, eukaryotic type [Aurantiacibacter gangjinensis]KLE31900.1 6-phosphogluconolactonase [Aurantiacibacter gangjinensis]
MADIHIIEGASDSEIAAFIEAALAEALAVNQAPVAISVPGGSTPFPIMEELVKADLDWARVTVWPGDDRVVPEDHEASNTGKIRALFEPAGAQVATLTVMEQVPHFALVWLGMGADGHIASLFPNFDPKVDEDASIKRLTPDPLPPEAPFDRITLTMPALLDSDALMFVIRGDDKRAVFDAAVEGEHDLPVARVLGAAEQKVTCFT